MRVIKVRSRNLPVSTVCVCTAVSGSAVTAGKQQHKGRPSATDRGAVG